MNHIAYGVLLSGRTMESLSHTENIHSLAGKQLGTLFICHSPRLITEVKSQKLDLVGSKHTIYKS